jgi:hypothetical protein
MMNDKQEMIGVVAEAALAELDKLERRHVKLSSPRQVLEQLFKNMADPQPAEETISPPPPLPQAPPEFPRLLANYGKTPPLFSVVQNFQDWSQIHEWFCVWPPSQPAGRAVETTLAQELEKLKSEGFTERPKEEHERRRQSNGYTK